MYARVPLPPAVTPWRDDAYARTRRIPLVRRVREDGPEYRRRLADESYEAEGSERRALGSVAVTPDAHWAATLTVPIPDGGVAFIRLRRHGPLPATYRGGDEAADFSVPIGELDALLALLAGVMDQARRDGVLPGQP